MGLGLHSHYKPCSGCGGTGRRAGITIGNNPNQDRCVGCGGSGRIIVWETPQGQGQGQKSNTEKSYKQTWVETVNDIRLINAEARADREARGVKPNALARLVQWIWKHMN